MSKSRWITFDCYGTLTDWNEGFRSILEPIAGAQVEALVAAYRSLEGTVQNIAPHHTYREVLAITLERAAALCGIELEPSARSVIGDEWQQIKPFNGIEEVLSQLRDAEYRLAILTNCDNDLFQLTERQFLRPFDLVVTAEDVVDYKPSQSHFRRFQRLTGATTETWRHVACSWHHDIVPTATLGIPSVWLDREGTGEDAKLASMRISHADDVPSAIDRLTA